MTWAVKPKSLVKRFVSKPAKTERTTIKAATPRPTPPTAKTEIRDKREFLLLALKYLRAMLLSMPIYFRPISLRAISRPALALTLRPKLA
jgi:hypothetical protein